MKKRVVLALGGNALGNNLKEQMQAVKITSCAIADLIEEGHDVVITHGNGPQVGMIQKTFEAALKSDPQIPHMTMSMCVALSQSYIGYDLQNALHEELLNRKIYKPVATVITQVIVDEKDPAFANPTKPIGSFYSEEAAQKMLQNGIKMKEDSGRGWRQVVASPKPVDIVEKNTVKALLEAGQIPITVGGGGIPVIKQGNHLKGVSAVIDKDFASSVLAQAIDADMLIILTAVERVAINFNTPQQQWLSHMTLEEARRYMAENQFAKGSMLPKVEAAVDFVASKSNRQSLITLLEKAKEGIAGKTGTIIS